MLDDFSLTDHVIIVTGAARGLGLAQAEAVLDAGATVYAFDILPSPSDEFETVQQKYNVNDTPPRLHYRQVDVCNSDAMNGLVEAISHVEGRLDSLIAAAGIQQETPALDYTASDMDRMLHVNVTGCFVSAQAVARQMIRHGKGGSIVLIGSMSGTVANRGLICPAYNASKAAVLQLARNLASEWGPAHGIRVNTLSPGYIETAMTAALFAAHPGRRVAWAADNMLGRLSAPAEYRGAAVFLCSRASAFMTGADLRIDGGHCAW